MARHHGIRVRHARSCPAARERDAKCRCAPTYEAWVYSKREKKKLRRSFPTLAAANAWRADATVGVRKGALRSPSRSTLRETADALIEGMKEGTVRTRSGDPYKPSVIRSYDSALKLHVLDDLGTRRLADVYRRDVQDLVDRLLADGLDPSTVRNAIMPLRVIFRRALTRDEVMVNPTTGLELPAVRGKRERVASPAEAAKLIAALPEADRTLWATALYAGLRLGELRALRVSDVKDGVVDVSRSWDDVAGPVAPKSAAGIRQVPIPATLVAHLTAHLERTGRADDELIFGRTRSAPFTDTYKRKLARGAWASTCECGHRADEHEDECKACSCDSFEPLTPIGFHECRHTYRSWLNAAGVDQVRRDWYLGHADHGMAGRYEHPLPGQLTKDAATLNPYLTGATDGKVVPLRTGAQTGAHEPESRMAATKS